MDGQTIVELRLKAIRESFGYTQSDIAKILGVNRSLISIWEQGYANIALRQLIKLCYIYKVPMDYILGLSKKINKNIKYKFKEEIDLKYIGIKVKEIRKSVGYTQEKFAKKLDTKRSSISYYEIGKMMMSTADLKQICEVFGYSADYIVGNTLECLKYKVKNKIKTKEIREMINN